MKQKILSFLVFGLCLPLFMHAQTLFPGQVLPDNIENANCYISPPSTIWDIEELKNVSTTPLSVFQTPIIGDLDGDGIPEIAINNGNNNGVVIYNGKDLSTVDRMINAASLNLTGTALGMVKTLMEDGSYVTLLVYLRANTLVAYNYSTSSTVWSTTVPYGSATIIPFGFVDFNGDEYVEIYMGNTILDAATGNILWQGTGKSGFSQMMHNSYLTTVGDVLNKGVAQFIIANQVYDISINRTTYTATLTLAAELTLASFTMQDGSSPPVDGSTIVIDLDLDGNLDVLVVNSPYTAGGTMQMYVWTPATNSVLTTNSVTDVSKRGFPLIGDIDGDGYSEIVIITGYNIGDVTSVNDFIRGFKYVSGNDALNQIWALPHTDRSGFTGLTLFDFNQDGITELVYRDETHLRIINASGVHHSTGLLTVPYDLAKIECTSATRAEMPVIADIDNDGHAEIITVGSATEAFALVGPLRIFKGPETSQWAPARPIWNQYAYNAVYINKDLSIPKVPINLATVFPGSGAGVVRPFNNFLQQQTTLSQDGVPLWVTPKAEIAGTPTFSYDGSSGGKMTITLQVKNTGDAIFKNPFYVSVFRDAVGGSPNYTYKYENTIDVGETITLTLVLENFETTWTPNNFLIIKINAKSDGVTDQEVCDEDNVLFFYYGLLPTGQEACRDNIGEMESTFTHHSYYTYQWQYSTNEITWTDISGATVRNYMPTYQEPGIGYYRLKITDSNDPMNIVYHYTASVKVISRRCVMPVNPNIHIFQ